MEWRLFADLAETAGERRVEVEVEAGGTVGDALDRLLEAHPALEDRVIDDGRLAAHLTVLKNGRNVRTEEEGLDTVVDGDDELALFPPVSGGAVRGRTSAPVPPGIVRG